MMFDKKKIVRILYRVKKGDVFYDKKQNND